MAKFNGCVLELKLIAQTPMIHFQAGEACDRGATVRATELKPKLDRYLMHIQGWKEDQLPLNYKVQIFCEKPGEVFPLNKVRERRDKNGRIKTDQYGRIKYEGYSIYFGNTGRVKRGLKEIKGLISNPTVRIICMNAGLRTLIEENIVNFFLSTNFGTMQNKGFGSFIPDELHWDNSLSDDQKIRIARALKGRIGAEHCYMMEFAGSTMTDSRRKKALVDVFAQIQDFCRIMKSGKNPLDKSTDKDYPRSFLFQYMQKYYPNLNNEKAWMKKRGISPNIRRNTTPAPGPNTSTNQNSRYMRAFLGTAEDISYITELENDKPKKGRRMTIKIRNAEEEKDNSKEVLIQRVQNPLFFKIIRNCVFIVTSQIDPELYGRPFEFFKDKENNGTIKTLSRKDLVRHEFDMNKFLSEYVDYYNSQALRRRLHIDKYQKVGTVDE